MKIFHEALRKIWKERMQVLAKTDRNEFQEVMQTSWRTRFGESIQV